MEINRLGWGEALGVAGCFALPAGIVLYEISRWLADISPDGKDVFISLLAAGLLTVGIKAARSRLSMKL